MLIHYQPLLILQTQSELGWQFSQVFKIWAVFVRPAKFVQVSFKISIIWKIVAENI